MSREPTPEQRAAIEAEGEIVFQNGVFTGGFSDGYCVNKPSQTINLEKIVADPFLDGMSAFHVLSKSYEVNFTALFVQASQSGVAL